MLETKNNFWMSPTRLKSLVDAIFAIAMTLLVLELDIPHIAGQISDLSILKGLEAMYSQFEVFAISFILLSIFWILHHRIFHFVKKINAFFLFCNVIWLLFIVLVPFSQLILATYEQFEIPYLFFNFNMIYITFLITLIWVYATRNDLLYPHTEKRHINNINIVCMSYLSISILAVGLTFLKPILGGLIYIALIPIGLIMGRDH